MADSPIHHSLPPSLSLSLDPSLSPSLQLLPEAGRLAAAVGGMESEWGHHQYYHRATEYDWVFYKAWHAWA